MKRLLTFTMILVIMYACKKEADPVKQEIRTSDSVKIIDKKESNNQSSPIFKELIAFANIEVGYDTNPEKFFQVKTIDPNGNLSDSNIIKGIDLYKKALKSQSVDILPIFEIINTDQVILIVKGKGYMDIIWAKVLINKNTQKISKISFGHVAESEGYGAAITYNTFENKFTGAKISFSKNTFGLTQNGKNLIKGGQKIDGISGATITSQAVVQMLNTELKKYQSYLLD
ncbi:FMN-binding protein [uncultured Aquimarina sp.]|uniref:FMN-binding protein n=1 Tax=uncultured Aquimarina sp. TaxID=575652 RepID=UPI00261E6555|nr:FMN-binding protein [uncultured Aquimarina sp.]